MQRTQLPDSLEILTHDSAEGGAVYLHCREHNYWSGQGEPRISGCPACWLAFYYYMFGKKKTLPGEPEAMLRVTRNAVQDLERRGTWDVELLPHPKIEKLN